MQVCGSAPHRGWLFSDCPGLPQTPWSPWSCAHHATVNERYRIVPLEAAPLFCCWNTSKGCSSSISNCATASVSLMGCPPNPNLICLLDKPCHSRWAFISWLSGVCLLILKYTTKPSCPATFRLMWSFLVFTPTLGFSSHRAAPWPQTCSAERWVTFWAQPLSCHNCSQGTFYPYFSLLSNCSVSRTVVK